jgi:hypothetical protein
MGSETRPRIGRLLAWLILGGLGLGTFIIASPAEKPIVAAGLCLALAIYIVGQVVGNAQERAKRANGGAEQITTLPNVTDVRVTKPKPLAGGRRYDPAKSYTPRNVGSNNGDSPHLRVL